MTSINFVALVVEYLIGYLIGTCIWVGIYEFLRYKKPIGNLINQTVCEIVLMLRNVKNRYIK